MIKRLKSVGFVTMAWLAGAAPAAAETSVAVTIAPAHSLVARVMAGVGEPALIVRPGASPHGYAMRPTEAAALNDAQVVFWIGEALENWMEGPLETLSADALVVELAAVDGLTLRESRSGGVWEGHDHHDHGDDEGHDDHEDHDDHGDHDHEDHAEDGHDEHAHEDHDDHGHEADDHEAHDHEDEEHEDEEHAGDHDEHAHEGLDPHLWLDPENAKVWLTAIAATLGEADPANAATYAANAAAARAEIDALTTELDATLAPVRDRPFIVFHDAYQYFEARFGLNGAGSISLGDADRPSPARVEAVRDRVRALGRVCVFSEPQFAPKLVATVTEGSEARTGEIDPVGAALAPGASLYPQLLRAMAAEFVRCLDAAAQ